MAISAKMKKYIANAIADFDKGIKMFLIEIHGHIFNYLYVDNGWLRLKLPFKKWFLHGLENAVGLFGKISHFFFGKETVMYYHNFMERFNAESMETNLIEWMSYEQNSIHCALAIDFTDAIKGRSQRSYEQQLRDLSALKKKYPERLLLAVMLDPNNPDMLKLFRLAFDELDFDIIKYYPSLTGLPSHPLLMESVWPIAQKKKIPIIVHCSSAGVHRTDMTYHLVGKDKFGNNINKVIKYKNENDIANDLNNPLVWLSVLEIFPDLYVDFAHGGGKMPGFFNTIVAILRKFKNAKSDLSYTFHDLKEMTRIYNFIVANPDMADKFMYASDFFMDRMEGSHTVFRQQFLDIVKDKTIRRKLLFENAMNLLNI